MTPVHGARNLPLETSEPCLVRGLRILTPFPLAGSLSVSIIGLHMELAPPQIEAIVPYTLTPNPKP